MECSGSRCYDFSQSIAQMFSCKSREKAQKLTKINLGKIDVTSSQTIPFKITLHYYTSIKCMVIAMVGRVLKIFTQNTDMISSCNCFNCLFGSFLFFFFDYWIWIVRDYQGLLLEAASCSGFFSVTIASCSKMITLSLQFFKRKHKNYLAS